MLKQREMAFSGQVCPKAGLWVSLGPEKESKEFKDGDVFPYINGKRARWKFLLHLLN